MSDSSSFELYILRHADAEKQNYETDFLRQITPYGVSQMARWRGRTKEFNLDFALISAAKRTKQTFELLESNVAHHFLDELYECTYNKFLRLVPQYLNLYTDPRKILLIGHNPFVSDLASTLSGSAISLGTADLLRLKVTDFQAIEDALQASGLWDVRAL